MSVATQIRMVDRNYENGFVDGTKSARDMRDEYARIIKFSPDSDRNTRMHYEKSLSQRMENPQPIYEKGYSHNDAEKINQRIAKLKGELQVFDTRGNMFGIMDNKVAKLGKQFLHNVSTNYEKAIEKKSMTSSFSSEQKSVVSQVEPTIAVQSSINPTVVNEKPADVVIDFNPRELQEKVNASFEGIVTAPAKPAVAVEEEFEPVNKVPRSERSAKLYLSEDSVKDIAIPVQKEDEAALTAGKIPVFSNDTAIRNERSNMMGNNDYIVGSNETKDDLSVDLDDDIERLANEIAEKTNEVAAERSLAEEERLENKRAAEELEEVKARAKEKTREIEKYRQEAERLERQKEEAEKVHQATKKTAMEKLRADRNRIMEEKRRLEEARQREAELANELWKQRTDTEQRITMIATEIPTIQDEIENTRNTIDMIMKRSREIQSMANVTPVEEPVPEKSNIALFNETLDSIFGDSFDSIDSSYDSSYSKGKKSA